jgi:hypothetical protein
VIASIALFVSLGGVSYGLASGSIDSREIKNNDVRGKDIRSGTVTGSDVRNDSLTGVDIRESTLGQVPRATVAARATNAERADAAERADSIGGTPLSGLLQVAGCQPGKVLGYARIKATTAGFPTTYTSSPSFIDLPFNCAGGTVEVRRAAAGRFFVRFAGNPAQLAVASSTIIGTDASASDNIASAGKVTTGEDAGAFRVDMRDADGNTTTLEDAPFTLLLP